MGTATSRWSAAPGRAGTDCLPIACSRSPEQGISADRCSGLPRRPLRVHDQPVEASHDRSAVRPEADTMNQTVRSLFTSPERRFSKPGPLRAASNPLNHRPFDIRTKLGVVRLLRRKWGERVGKWPEVDLAAAARGSDKWPEKPTLCGFPTADQEPKKNVPTGCLGGGRGTVDKPSPGLFQ
jgi:hypothetical protein